MYVHMVENGCGCYGELGWEDGNSPCTRLVCTHQDYIQETMNRIAGRATKEVDIQNSVNSVSHRQKGKFDEYTKSQSVGGLYDHALQ